MRMAMDISTPTSITIPGRLEWPTTSSVVGRSGTRTVPAHGEYGFRLYGSRIGGERVSFSTSALCTSDWSVLETLAHLLLEMECLDRPRIYCQSCTYLHSNFSFYSAIRLEYRSTSAYWKIRFLCTLERRLVHNCSSYLFEGCCFIRYAIVCFPKYSGWHFDSLSRS